MEIGRPCCARGALDMTSYDVCHRLVELPSSRPASMATSRWSRLSWLLVHTRRPKTRWVFMRPYGRGGEGVSKCGEGATTCFTLHRSGARHPSERPAQGVTPRWSWRSWLPGADGDPSQGEAAEASGAAHTPRWSWLCWLPGADSDPSQGDGVSTGAGGFRGINRL